MSRPRLLDLFCGAGGSAKGYQDVGFYVVGVDIEEQPNYCGDEFVQADALDLLAGAWTEDLREFDLIHASPPCQAYSRITRVHALHPDLVASTRDMLDTTGVPYVIENVEGAPLRAHIRLCGSMFGLQIQRHRYFELSGFPMVLTPACNHKAWDRGRAVTITGHFGINGGSPDHSLEPFGLEDARRLMGIDWMTRSEIVEAIPPAYTQFIGGQFLEQRVSVLGSEGTT